MIISNNTKNTIYIEDIDLSILYKNGESEYIDPETLKKSKGLRSLITQNILDVIEYNSEERIESSIMYMKSKSVQPTVQEPLQTVDQESNNPAREVDAVRCSSEIEVKIHGIFYDASGYGKVNRNLAIGLNKAGIKVKIDPKRSKNQLKEDEIEPIAKLQNTAISRNHITIDSIIPSFAEVSTGKYKILYSTIESYSIPKQFQESCDIYDEIWLTSHFSAEILKQYTKKPIYVISPGTDPELYNENGPRFDFSTSCKKFIFLSVFGWNYRKGYDVLLKAYFDEFTSKDDVTLLIVSRYQSGQDKHHKLKIKEDIEAIMKQFPNKDLPHVMRYSKITPEKDMPKIYRASNCFVLPARGEGFCIPPLEASLCGLPVILTNCSGQTEYMRNDNCYPIEIDKIEALPQGLMKIHYWDNQLFPKLTSVEVHENLKKTMRHVYNNYNEAKQRNKKMQKLILENFTWTNTANAAVKRLIQIQEKLRG